jgi:phage shock protein C
VNGVSFFGVRPFDPPSGRARNIVGPGRVGSLAGQSNFLEKDGIAMGNTLQRSRNDKVIAGVIGGLAHRFGVSSTTLRIAYVALSVLSAAFPGIIVYLLLWVIMPQGSYYEG